MDEPVELLHYYINVSLIMGDHTFDDYDLLEQMLEKKRIVISSIGGAGKTILLKWVWIAYFVSPRGKIPIYLELRQFEGASRAELVTFLRGAIGAHKSE
jgi:hypothetical protein